MAMIHVAYFWPNRPRLLPPLPFPTPSSTPNSGVPATVGSPSQGAVIQQNTNTPATTRAGQHLRRTDTCPAGLAGVRPLSRSISPKSTSYSFCSRCASARPPEFHGREMDQFIGYLSLILSLSCHQPTGPPQPTASSRTEATRRAECFCSKG